MSGLDVVRRCGFLPAGRVGPTRIVWARGPVATEVCPKSMITAESWAHLEQFGVWKTVGLEPMTTMPAKQVDALRVLDQEWMTERQNAER